MKANMQERHLKTHLVTDASITPVSEYTGESIMILHPLILLIPFTLHNLYYTTNSETKTTKQVSPGFRDFQS